MPRRESVDDRGAVVERGHHAITLEPFVGLHAPVHGVAVLDLGVLDLVAEHSALLVDERDVVVDPGAELHPDVLGRPRAVALAADLDDVVRHRGHNERRQQHDGEGCRHPSLDPHVILLVSYATGLNALFVSRIVRAPASPAPPLRFERRLCRRDPSLSSAGFAGATPPGGSLEGAKSPSI